MDTTVFYRPDFTSNREYRMENKPICLIVKSNESEEWFKDKPECHKSLLLGYKETIPLMGDSVIYDIRTRSNDHIVNEDFEITPKFFMSLQPKESENICVLSCIYVFPGFRNKGFSSQLIDTAKNAVGEYAVLQAAVECKKYDELRYFYEKFGFKTTGIKHKDDIGVEYIDFFWSKREMILSDNSKGTGIEFINEN